MAALKSFFSTQFFSYIVKVQQVSNMLCTFVEKEMENAIIQKIKFCKVFFNLISQFLNTIL